MKALMCGAKLSASVVVLTLAACSSGIRETDDGDADVTRHAITISTNTGGNVSPESATVGAGQSVHFNLAPDPGFGVEAVSGCNGRLVGNTFIVDSVASSCTVEASFIALDGLAAPAAPVLTLKPQRTKVFDFNWRDVEAETHYQLLENADGMSGYSPVADIAADTDQYEHVVLLPARINASYILQACNAAGCSDSPAVFVDDRLAEAVGYFKAAFSGINAAGWSTALSADGKTLAMGAPDDISASTGIDGGYHESPFAAHSSGAVYVFASNNGTWSQQAYIKASNAEELDLFGMSVTLSADGNTLAVGATGEASEAVGIDGDQQNNVAPASGAVYVFTRDATRWRQTAYVKASDTTTGNRFGHVVALAASGDTLAVGAHATDSVHLFVRNGSSWTQQALIVGTNTEASDAFGLSVGLSNDGNTLAVGAMAEDGGASGVNGADNNEALDSGAVYLFTRRSDTWSQQAYIKASSTRANSRFGSSVAVAGDGNMLAVGAQAESSNGAAYIFTRASNRWEQQAFITASNTAENALFGASIALSANGDTLAVSAYNEPSGGMGIEGEQRDASAPASGAAYLFARSANVWRQQAYVKAPLVAEGALFGWSLALSGDGNALAVGARREQSGATGINGSPLDQSPPVNTGAVYLY